VSPLRGENPIFGPLSKNNTGMAALRAGLPVTSIADFGVAESYKSRRNSPSILLT